VKGKCSTAEPKAKRVRNAHKNAQIKCTPYRLRVLESAFDDQKETNRKYMRQAPAYGEAWTDLQCICHFVKNEETQVI
jgi:hypothetical protein